MNHDRSFTATSSDQNPQKEQTAQNISSKKQWIWMISLWIAGVASLWLFVKVAKIVMSLVGLGASS